MTYKLLIVDDETANLRLLERLFSRDYQCLTAASGAEAIRILEQHDVAIMITDQRMPEMTGIELLKQTSTLRPHMVRILLTGYTDVEALVEAINSGLVYMYFTKPWNNEDLKLKVTRAQEHYENNRKRNSLTLANDRLVARFKETELCIVNGLAEMLKTRGDHAYEHALRVRNCAIAIADKMSLGDDDKEGLAAAAILHDLGHLDQNVNQSTSPHSSSSFIAKAHAQCEARFLSSLPELGSIADIVMFQRENFDGTGAPTWLRDEQIPQTARILRVADEYDSILRPQGSAAPMTHQEAMRFLSQRSGKQFDGRVVAVLETLEATYSVKDVAAWQFASTPALLHRNSPGRSVEPSVPDSLVP